MRKVIFALMFVLLCGIVLAQDPLVLQGKKGWNLVTYHVINELPMQLAKDNNMYIFYLDPQTKKYRGGDVVAAERMFEGMREQEAQLGGFWLYSNADFKVEFYFRGDVERKIDSLRSPHLRKGWNLLALTDLVYGKSLNDLQGNCEYKNVYYFEEGKWAQVKLEDYQGAFTRGEMGYALAVKVAKDCSLSFEEPMPSIPALPN